jgi:putative sterol carrier protein
VNQGLAADEARAKTVVAKVKGAYLFVVKTGDKEAHWTVDLKNGTGSVSAGKTVEKPDCTLTLGEAELVQLLTGKLNPQQAFMKGKLKIAGNMGIATKLTEVLALRPKAKL